MLTRCKWQKIKRNKRSREKLKVGHWKVDNFEHRPICYISMECISLTSNYLFGRSEMTEYALKKFCITTFRLCIPYRRNRNIIPKMTVKLFVYTMNNSASYIQRDQILNWFQIIFKKSFTSKLSLCSKDCARLNATWIFQQRIMSI